jgi:hypothetical protein
VTSVDMSIAAPHTIASVAAWASRFMLASFAFRAVGVI